MLDAWLDEQVRSIAAHEREGMVVAFRAALTLRCGVVIISQPGCYRIAWPEPLLPELTSLQFPDRAALDRWLDDPDRVVPAKLGWFSRRRVRRALRKAGYTGAHR